MCESFLEKTEHRKWESQIEAWQTPILQDKRFPEWLVLIYLQIHELSNGFQ